MKNFLASTKGINAVRLRADLTLLLAAAIWGGGFVAQRAAAAHLGTFAINGLRFSIGALALLPLAGFRLRYSRQDLTGVLLLGLLIFTGSSLQQAGLAMTTAANAGFITDLYVVIIPILLVLFGRQRLRWNTWVAVLIATIGIYFLSVQGSFQLNPGDLFVLVGALAWALHVILIGKMTRQMDVFQLNIGQFLVSGVLSLAAGAIFELETFRGIGFVWPAIIYAGLFSTAAGFCLQAIGQRQSPTSDAAIILSMEAVFAALFGYLFLSETLNALQLLGCGMILAAIFLAQTTANLPA